MRTGLRMQARAFFAKLEKTSWALLPQRHLPSPSFVLISVYRHRNASLLRPTVESALATGNRVMLWALDEVDDSLRSYTFGHGPGSRGALLNRLFAQAAPADNEAVVICDDDVRWVRGSVADVVALASKCGFSLAQPAHIRTSQISYTFTFARPLYRARSTTFVESGPVVVVDRSFRSRVFPMPEEGMGWGLEAVWNGRRHVDERFGIIDDVVIEHLGQVGGAYAMADERAMRDQVLADHSLTDMSDLCRTTGRWWIWERAPRWT